VGGALLASFTLLPCRAAEDQTPEARWRPTDGNEQVIYQAWQFYAACGLGMLGVAGALLAYRLRVERRILELKQEAVLVRERERLARDMHDGLGVSLTRIKRLSEVASRQCSEAADLRAQLRKIAEASAEMVREMDEVVWAVNPRNDTLDKLADYLSRSADEYLHLSGIRCRLVFPTALPERTLSSEMRHSVFLIVKEALHNVVKHSGATQLGLELTAEGPALRLCIEDNGRGFDLAADGQWEGHDGLGNMRRRAQALGGILEIQSKPGAGTRLVLNVPLP